MLISLLFLSFILEKKKELDLENSKHFTSTTICLHQPVNIGRGSQGNAKLSV